MFFKHINFFLIKEIKASNKTIEELQNQLMNQTNDKMNTSVDSTTALDDKISRSIEQLSLIILSKVKFIQKSVSS